VARLKIQSSLSGLQLFLAHIFGFGFFILQVGVFCLQVNLQLSPFAFQFFFLRVQFAGKHF